MKKYISIILFLVFTSFTFSQSTSDFLTQMDSFLKENVLDGKVAYSKIHKNQNTLNNLMDVACKISVSKENANLYQAFWINAYNLSVIKGVIDDYPMKSPLDNAGFFDKTTYKLAGKQITLNDIEKKLLIAQFKDARFHFVLVCGAIGCPPLINKAYLPDTLDAQLTEQTTLAINGDYFIRVNAKKKRVAVSEIFKWYKKDFTKNKTSEVDFINKYRTDKIPNTYKLSYHSYDWKLNSFK
ncbi:MAG: DUF547 domain-containing protein [Flavobacteriaceae bacterium]|nr:DUF547 domain-containing protein [Flavobacteriaceae bacterium]